MKLTVLFLLSLLCAFLPTGYSSALGAPAVVDAPEVQRLLDEAHQKNLGQDRQWRDFLHYKRTLFGLLRSQVLSPAFFLDPEGYKDSDKELDATIRSLFVSTERQYETPFADEMKASHQPASAYMDHQAPRCQFPARFIWLKSKLSIDESKLPPVKCERFERFKQNLSAKSVSVVFSSYYLNNPSSAFGHSFLRISRNPSGSENAERYELLDHGVNFAATVSTENPVAYAVYGLAGMFKGTYSNVPYYYKVREYNDHEARDLWSYDLNLTDDEINLLVAHLWELGPTYFNYYFFTQNCSYQILTAIEAVAPRYRVTDSLPSLYVIPSDTVKELTRVPGLVKNVTYRPSVRALFLHRLALLNPTERNKLRELTIEKKPVSFESDFSRESQVRVLDAALDYMDYRHSEELAKPESESSKQKQTLLLARAELPVRSEVVKISPSDEDKPHMGHGSTRINISEGYEGAGTVGNTPSPAPGNFTEGRIRFALHDALDPEMGYPRNAEISFFDIRGRYYWQPKTVELERATLFRVLSLSPRDDFNSGFSWKVDVGAKRVRDGNCDRCMAGGFEVGGGYSVEPFSHPWLLVYALGEGEASYSSQFLQGKGRLGVGPALGVLARQGPLHALVEANYRYQGFSAVANTYEAIQEARWALSQSWAVSLRGAEYKDGNELAASAFWYF